jgi:hypothetical protein
MSRKRHTLCTFSKGKDNRFLWNKANASPIFQKTTINIVGFRKQEIQEIQEIQIINQRVE